MLLAITYLQGCIITKQNISELFFFRNTIIRTILFKLSQVSLFLPSLKAKERMCSFLTKSRLIQHLSLALHLRVRGQAASNHLLGSPAFTPQVHAPTPPPRSGDRSPPVWPGHPALRPRRGAASCFREILGKLTCYLTA